MPYPFLSGSVILLIFSMNLFQLACCDCELSLLLNVDVRISRLLGLAVSDTRDIVRMDTLPAAETFLFVCA